MKSLVTNRSVSPGPIGVSVPPGPLGAFQTPSITGLLGVPPSQWNWTLSPDTCGNRPVLIDVSQKAEKPFSNAVFTCAPVRVRIVVRLPNGRTANTSPHVISPGCSPAVGGL